MLLSNIEWIFSWAILRYHTVVHSWDHMNISIIMFLLSLVVGPKVQPVGYQYRLYLYYVYWLHAYIIHCWHGLIFYKIFYLSNHNSIFVSSKSTSMEAFTKVKKLFCKKILWFSSNTLLWEILTSAKCLCWWVADGQLFCDWQINDIPVNCHRILHRHRYLESMQHITLVVDSG